MTRRLTLTTGIALMSLSLLYLGASTYRARVPLRVENVGELHAPTLGQNDAAVDMLVFTDYRCPHCMVFERDVMPELETLVADGSLRLTLVPVAMLGEDSALVAASALCAARQGEAAFTRLHKPLFDLPGVNQQALVELAARYQVRPQPLRECLEEGKAAGEVDENTRRARELGLRGTPTVVVEGKAYANPSWATLQGVVGGL